MELWAQRPHSVSTSSVVACSWGSEGLLGSRGPQMECMLLWKPSRGLQRLQGQRLTCELMPRAVTVLRSPLVYRHPETLPPGPGHWPKHEVAPCRAGRRVTPEPARVAGQRGCMRQATTSATATSYSRGGRDRVRPPQWGGRLASEWRRGQSFLPVAGRPLRGCDRTLHAWNSSRVPGFLGAQRGLVGAGA